MDKLNRIIAFGGRKGSGKTELAKMLTELSDHPFKKMAFGDELKLLCAKLCGIDSLEELNRMKNDPNEKLNFVFNYESVFQLARELRLDSKVILDYKLPNGQSIMDIKIETMRDMLQIIGTDIIRKIDPDWHVKKVREKIESMPSTTRIVIDDVRFPNELALIEDGLFGDFYFIIRPTLDNVSNHESETSISFNDCSNAKNIIINDGTLEALKEEWMSYAMTGERNKRFCLFNYQKNYDGYPFAFYAKSDNQRLEDFVAGLLLSKNQITGDYIGIDRETGIINYRTDNELQFQALRNILCCNYEKREQGKYYEISLYNPFIVESLKKYVSL